MDPVMRNRPGQVPRRGGGNQFMPMPPVQDPGMMNILPAEPPQGGMPNSPDDLRPYMSPGAQPLDQYPGYRGGPNPAIGPAVMPPMPAPGVGRYGPVTGMMPPVQGQFMPPVEAGGGNVLMPMPGRPMPFPGGMPPLLGGGNLSDYIGKKGDGGMPPMMDPGMIPPPPGIDQDEWEQFLRDRKAQRKDDGSQTVEADKTAKKGTTSRQMERGRGLKDRERSKATTKPKIGKQPPKVAYDSPPTKPPQMLPPQRDPLEYATGVQSKSLRDRKSDSRIKPTGTRQKG